MGFESAGFEVRVAVDSDPRCVRTLRANRPQWPLVDADINSPQATSARLLRRAGFGAGDADVLVGGPPCQPFSKAGYWASGEVKGLDDPRAGTIEAFLRVLRDIQPRVFLLENVPGIAFSQKDEGLVYLRRSIDRINRRLGTQYSFSVQLLNAVEFGVPQRRRRVFVVGCRDGTDFRFPSPTHLAGTPGSDGTLVGLGDPDSRAGSGGLRPTLTAWDAIGDLEGDDHPALRVTGKWADLLRSVPEGENYLYHTSRGRGEPLFGWRRRYWNFLLKLSKGLPSWTIPAQPGPATGPFHWKSRRLSPSELARLQTFPEHYEVQGSLREVQWQLGNAVPSALAESVALEIRRQVLGDAGEQPAATLVPRQRGGMPGPEPVMPVPKKYAAQIGVHEAHPGAGRGPSAVRWAKPGSG